MAGVTRPLPRSPGVRHALSSRRGKRVGVRGARLACLLAVILAPGLGIDPAVANDGVEWLDADEDVGDACLFDCQDTGRAGDDETNLPDGLRLYDDKGRRTGRVEKDPVFEGRSRLYDEKGRFAGRVEADPVFEGRYRLYDEDGRRAGYVEADPVFEGRYRVYDERGRRTGEVRRNPVFGDRYDIYDERGRRTGRAEEHP